MTDELPIALRAHSSRTTVGWLRRSRHTYRYDARFAGGREVLGVSADAVLNGARYPADAQVVRRAAERECPDEGTGPWVDYPWGRALLLSHLTSAALPPVTDPLSHVVQHDGIAYLSGIIGQRTDGALASDDVAEQAHAVTGHLMALLGELDAWDGDVLKTTVYLTDYGDIDAVNGSYARFFREPFPARTTVQVAALPLGAKVQLDAVVATHRKPPTR